MLAVLIHGIDVASLYVRKTKVALLNGKELERLGFFRDFSLQYSYIVRRLMNIVEFKEVLGGINGRRSWGEKRCMAHLHLINEALHIRYY